MRFPQLEIINPLVNLGEEVEIETTTDTAGKLHLTVTANYLEDSAPRSADISVVWHGRDEHGHYKARASYRPARPGNYFVQFEGKKGKLPSRYFAAVNPGCAVANPFLNGAAWGAETYDDVVHPGHIPFEYHVSGRFVEQNRSAFEPFVQFEYLYGDCIIPRATTWDLGFADRLSLWGLSETETIEAIQELQRLWLNWGFCPLRKLNIHWCMGNVTMHAARKCGIRVFNALVPNYYMRDGESRELNTGTPLRPYFMSHEDFRKPGPFTDDYVLCTPFTVPIPTDFHRGNVHAHWAPDIQQFYDCSVESGAQSYRSCEILDVLCEQPQEQAPFFFPISIQNWGPRTVYENNRNALRYAIQKAREGKLVFANSEAIRDYYVRHFRQQPETISYTRDFMVGSWFIDKPMHHPDVIQIENSHLHAAFNRGEPLPAYFYDYDRVWDYPDKIFRDLKKFGPEPETTAGVRVQQRIENVKERTRVVIEIKADRDFGLLTVAEWEIPILIESAEVQTTPALRFVPVEAPYERSQHALVLGAVNRGDTTWEILLQGRQHEATAHLCTYHNIAGLKTIPNPGRFPYTYVWCELPGETCLRLSVPTGRPVWGEYYDGSRRDSTDGKLILQLKWPRPWARVWNVRADEVTIENGSELDSKAIQVFDETLRRWPMDGPEEPHRLLEEARAELATLSRANREATYLPHVLAANRDYQNRFITAHCPQLVEQTRQWFRETTAGRKIRQILVTAHAYRKGHLGGPWRDKADLDDVIECVDGVQFSVPIYDYGLSWAPGHSAWNMGRMLTIRLQGLQAYSGRQIVIYLHGYDYDRLGRAYNVKFIAREIAGGKPVEMRYIWLVPPGPEGRTDPSSLLCLVVPDEYLALSQFDVRIMEGYYAPAIDMRRQVPYSVAISDVWVTEEE